MKKNSKGFTLVELLAAIVILGIIALFALPAIVNMVSKSRNKMYITDAEKMVALTEYKLKASNSVIEIPDEGDCIVVSMVYLDSSDFDTAPNDGKYQKEKSFVVVKNVGGSLDYSVMIVEKTKKRDLRGLELTNSKDLEKRSTTGRITTFKKTDLVEDIESMDKSYINTHLDSNYIENGNTVSAIYNYPDLVDSSSGLDEDAAPRIKSVYADSTNPNFNTLTVLLKVSAEDTDTLRKDLTVYISTKGYKQEATSYIYESVSYGTAQTFTKTFNLANYLCTDGALCSYSRDNKIVFYVVVADPQGNEDRKQVTYEIHKNNPPEIDASATTIGKRPVDPKEMTTAYVRFGVSDDITPVRELQVCLEESTSSTPATSCDNYQDYFSVFDDNHSLEYQFMCDGSGCRRDGSTHYLNIFVKDAHGSTASTILKYTFSTNVKPSFTENVVVVSKTETFTDTGSRRVIVKVRASDDVDAEDQISVSISDGTITNEYMYSDNLNNDDFDFDIDPTKELIYDGSKKTITVTLTDTEGLTNTQNVEYTLYKNKKPTVSNLSIYSNGTACPNANLCPTESGGSKEYLYSFEVEDDIDRANHYSPVRVAVSTNADDCNDDSNYTSYSDYYDGIHSGTLTGSYDGRTETLYVCAKDTYGLTNSSSANYTIYQNQAPIIQAFNIQSQEEEFLTGENGGSLNTILEISAIDDFDESPAISVNLKEDGTAQITGDTMNTYEGQSVEYTLHGRYDGKNRKLDLTLTDQDAASSSQTVNYTVYKNLAPTIELFVTDPPEPACENLDLCPTSNGGKYQTEYWYSVEDDLDYADNFSGVKVCFTENPSTCKNSDGTFKTSAFTSYSDVYDPETNYSRVMNYTFSVNAEKPYENVNRDRTLYLYAMDSYDESATTSVAYKIYTNSGPVLGAPSVLSAMAGTSGVDDPIVTGSSGSTTIGQAGAGVVLKKVGDGDDDDTSGDDLPGDPVDEDYLNIMDVFFSIEAVDDFEEQESLMIKYCRDNDSNCTDYVPYTSEYELGPDFFPTNRYTGQTYGIYAYVKDLYGIETKSAVSNYTVYQDVSPVIDPAKAYYNDIDGNYQVFSINFIVSDPLDVYYVCVSEEGESCTYSTEPYDGTDNNPHAVTYNHLLDDTAQDVTLTLHVKDSYGNEVSKNVVGELYHSCEEFTTTPARYEYRFVFDKVYKDENGNNVTDNQPINGIRCEGKCYYRNPVTNEIHDVISYYDQILTYRDLANQELLCERNAVTVDYRTDCSFHECFFAGVSYERRSIGLKEYSDVQSWTVNYDGTDYVNNSHYKLYMSSYTDYAEKITLTPTTDKISPALVDLGVYDFDSASEDPYVRVADSN